MFSDHLSSSCMGVVSSMLSPILQTQELPLQKRDRTPPVPVEAGLSTETEEPSQMVNSVDLSQSRHDLCQDD